MDTINQDIWQNRLDNHDPLGLLRNLGLADECQSGDIRPQQVSPKSNGRDRDIFGPNHPLPMVPDFCWENYGKIHPSIMICGSAYAGFLTGYSQREGLTVKEYANCRDNPDYDAGGEDFLKLFREQVISRDSYYYGRLLGETGLTGIKIKDWAKSAICLTDLCKASIVRIRIDDDGSRHDEPGDGVVREGFNIYSQLVNPKWIYERMKQADLIIALGSLAEQGLAYSFWQASQCARISLNTNPEVIVSERRMNHLRTGYLHKAMNLGAWNNDQCWIMTNPERKDDPPLRMRPIYHPAHGPYPNGLLFDILAGLHLQNG